MLARPLGRARAAVAVLLLGGILFGAINADLPVLRNALLYARIHDHLVRADMRVWEVCPDAELVGDKACGFSVLASPLVTVFGLDGGLKVASVLGGLLFLLAAFAFFRRFNPRFGLDDRAIPLELALSCFNPLVIYQFWSAYPDATFFAAFVYSFVLVDRILLDRDGGGLALAARYLLLMLLALFLKPWALTLFPLHALYVWANRPSLIERWREGPSRLLAAGAAFALALAFVVLAKLQLNLFMNLGGNEGQYDQPVLYVQSGIQFLIFLAITLGPIALLFPFLEMTRPTLTLLGVSLGYVHIFMVYMGATYNARYYIPVLPMLAICLTARLRSMPFPSLRAAMVATLLLVNGLTVLAFNSRVVYREIRAVLPGSWLQEFGYLDCLRMGAHLEKSASLQAVNASLPENARLFVVSSYYGEKTHGAYSSLGLLRKDLRVTYLSRPPMPQDYDDDAYAYFAPPNRPKPEATMEPLAPRLYRLR